METVFPISDKATNTEIQRMYSLLTFPVGIVVDFYGAKEDVPKGWLLLDASWVDIADYKVLYNLLKKNGKVVTETTKAFKLLSVTGKIIKV